MVRDREWATRHGWGEDLGDVRRSRVLIGVLRQRREDERIGQGQCQECDIDLVEMDDNRGGIRRINTRNVFGWEALLVTIGGIRVDLDGEGDVIRGEWLAVRPLQIRAQMESESLRVTGDDNATIARGRNLCEQSR